MRSNVETSSSSSPRRGVLSSGLDWLARATDDSGGDRGDDDDDVAGIGRGGGGRERGGDGGGARGDVESGQWGELQRAWERLRADGGGADGERATPSSGGGDDGVGEDGGAPTDAAADLTNSAAFRSGAFVANVSFFTHRPLSTFDRFPFQLTGNTHGTATSQRRVGSSTPSRSSSSSSSRTSRRTPRRSASTRSSSSS